MYNGFSLSMVPSNQLPAVQLVTADGCSNVNSLVSIERSHDGLSFAIVLGRIHYRQSLLGRQDVTGLSDAEVILEHFKKMGETELSKLEGDYSFVIWDGNARRFWLQRDPRGCWPLYWSKRRGILRISTRLQCVAATCSQSLEAIAQFLALPLPTDELPTTSTFYEGCNRVLPGHRMGIRSDGELAVDHAYWNWGEQIKCHSGLSRSDASSQLRILLEDSVRERIGSAKSVATHLSGGLDSSTIACLASELKDELNVKSVHTLAHVFNHQSLKSERGYIDEILRERPNLEGHFLDGEKTVYFDWFKDTLPMMDEPSSLMVSLPFHRALESRARSLGAEITLSGEGSDDILRVIPYHIAQEIRIGNWVTAWREVKRISAERNVPSLSTLWQYGLQPIFPILTREGPGWYLRGGNGVWPNLGMFSIAPWIKAGFAREQKLREKYVQSARSMFSPPYAQSWMRYTLQSTNGDWLRWTLATLDGANLAHPFKDPRVVCFVLGLPNKWLDEPGKIKPLLTDACSDLLPESLKCKKHSPGFDYLHGMGLRKNFPEILDMIRRSDLCTQGILDEAILSKSLEASSFGLISLGAADQLDRCLSLIRWHEQAQCGQLPSLKDEQTCPREPSFAPGHRASVKENAHV